MDNILEIRNLTASYEETEVLHGVSLDVKSGEVLCIVGESGSGKSTLIRTICNDERVKINAGTISFKGELLAGGKRGKTKKLLGEKIGLIQQNPEGAFNPIRPLEAQFKETAKSHGQTLDKEKLKQIFETMGLSDVDRILKSRPYEMSGGMNQRIAIAASFILEPELLLCDEITSALDVTTAIAVTDELLRLKQASRMSIVLVTHNLGIAANIADRIAIMYQGELVECAEKDVILKAPSHIYTKRLLQDVPKLKSDIA